MATSGWRSSASRRRTRRSRRPGSGGNRSALALRPGGVCRSESARERLAVAIEAADLAARGDDGGAGLARGVRDEALHRVEVDVESRLPAIATPSFRLLRADDRDARAEHRHAARPEPRSDHARSPRRAAASGGRSASPLRLPARLRPRDTGRASPSGASPRRRSRVAADDRSQETREPADPADSVRGASPLRPAIAIAHASPEPRVLERDELLRVAEPLAAGVPPHARPLRDELRPLRRYPRGHGGHDHARLEPCARGPHHADPDEKDVLLHSYELRHHPTPPPVLTRRPVLPAPPGAAKERSRPASQGCAPPSKGSLGCPEDEKSRGRLPTSPGQHVGSAVRMRARA